MKKIVTSLLVYHFVFLLSSMTALYITEGYGSEIFAGFWWFNVYYTTVGLLIHVAFGFLFARFIMSTSIATFLRFAGMLALLNVLAYFSGKVLPTIEMISSTTADERKMAFLIHSFFLVSFVASQVMDKLYKSDKNFSKKHS